MFFSFYLVLQYNLDITVERRNIYHKKFLKLIKHEECSQNHKPGMLYEKSNIKLFYLNVDFKNRVREKELGGGYIQTLTLVPLGLPFC